MLECLNRSFVRVLFDTSCWRSLFNPTIQILSMESMLGNCDLHYHLTLKHTNMCVTLKYSLQQASSFKSYLRVDNSGEKQTAVFEGKHTTISGSRIVLRLFSAPQMT